MAAPVRKFGVNWPGRKEQWDQDRGAGCFVRRIYYTQFNTVAGTTANLDLTGFPGGSELIGCFFWLVSNFAGGAISACTLSVGSTGTADAYLSATTVITGATKAIGAHTAFTTGLFLGGIATPNAVSTVRVQLLLTSANATALTSGSGDLHLVIRQHRLPTT